MKTLRAAFYTFGCKVNQYETQSLIGAFEADGFEICPPGAPCEVYVVNSCTVTGEGDNKTRKLLRRLRREHPGAVLALTGCYAQAAKDIAALVPEADVITGAANRAALLPAVRRFISTGRRVVEVAPHRLGEAFEPMAVSSFQGRTRAFVKIQDGCERFCAYCIIPFARGPFRSRPLGDLRAQLLSLSAAGYREVVLVGINLSAYGLDMGLHLLDAVELACNVKGIERVRLSSLEPEQLTGEVIRSLAALPRLCPQFHLSLQSGCDETLRRMRRHYTSAMYREIADNLRAHFPGAALTTDIMVGFPGESEGEFAQSLAFFKGMGFARAHVFAYSRRPGTAADRMEPQVPPGIKAQRSRQMLQAERESRLAFLRGQVGKECTVLFETQEPGGAWVGYSENYTPVRLLDGTAMGGKLCRVRLTALCGEACLAELAGEP